MMKDNEFKDNPKKVWNEPRIISLSTKKTEGGDYADQNEDYGTINTLPS